MGQEFNIVAQLQLQGPANLNSVVGNIKNQLKGIKAEVNLDTSSANSGFQRVVSGAQASSRALRQMQTAAANTSASLQATISVTNQGGSALQHFSEQAGLATRRLIAFSASAASIYGVVEAIKNGTKAAIDFQLSMNKVEQVSNEAGSKITELKAEIASLSTSLGVSSASLAETAITLKQAGLTADQTKSALKALALTDLAPSFDSIKQSTEGLIASFKQFNLTSGQFENSLASINAVAAGFAVESSDIVSAIQKAGGAFKATAGDMKSGGEALNEFISLFTSVRATTRESADSIATGLRTIFTRFQRGDTVKALQDLGVNLRYTRQEAEALGNTRLTDQFVGAYEAVRRLSEGLEGLQETSPIYSQVIEQLGGYRQISRVLPLLKEFKTAEEAKNIAIAGGLSLQLAAEKRQEALATQISRVKEEYLELFRQVADSDAFKTLANTMLTVASSFSKVLDFARPLLPLLVGLATVKVATSIGPIASNFTRALTAPPGAIVANQPNKGALRFSTGGVVPGTGNGDTVPAMLTPGEIVLNKQEVAKIKSGRGSAQLAKLRAKSTFVPPTDINAAEIFAPPADAKAVDVPFQPVQHIVDKDSSAHEAALEKAAREKIDTATPTTTSGKSDYLSRVFGKGGLSEVEQQHFTKYYNQVLEHATKVSEKLGHGGEPVETPALEAFAKLAIEKPIVGKKKGVGGQPFDITSPNALGAIKSTVRYGVINHLNELYGTGQDKVRVGAVPVDSEGNQFDFKAPGPKSVLDTFATTNLDVVAAQKQAEKDAEAARQAATIKEERLGTIREALPADGTRKAREEALKKQGIVGRAARHYADEDRFEGALTEAIRKKSGVDTPKPSVPTKKVDDLSANPSPYVSDKLLTSIQNLGADDQPKPTGNSQYVDLNGNPIYQKKIKTPYTLPGGPSLSGRAYTDEDAHITSRVEASRASNSREAFHEKNYDKIKHGFSLLGSYGDDGEYKLNSYDFTRPTSQTSSPAPAAAPSIPPTPPKPPVTTSSPTGGPGDEERYQNYQLDKAYNNESLKAAKQNKKRNKRRPEGYGRDYRDSYEATSNFGIPNDEIIERNRERLLKFNERSNRRELEGDAVDLSQTGSTLEERRAGQRNIGLPLDSLVVAKATRADRANKLRASREQEARVLGGLSAQRAQEEAAARAQEEQRVREQSAARRSSRDDYSFNVTGRTASEFAQLGRDASDLSARRTAQRLVGGGSSLDQKAATLNALDDPDTLAHFRANPQDAQAFFKQGTSTLSQTQTAVLERKFKAAGIDLSSQAGQSLTQGTASYTTAATRSQNIDGSQTLTGGLAARRADKLADSRIAARGGADALSEETKSIIRSKAAVEQDTALRREILSANKNLLAALRPEISAHERSKIAIEETNRAMTGLAKVAVDAKGAILGTQKFVDQATKAGISANGAGGFGYRASSFIGDKYNALKDRLATPTSFGKRLDGALSGPGAQFAGIGLAVGGSYLGDYFERRAGNADNAVLSQGGISKYSTSKGIGGAISGATAGAGIGAALGSVVPVIGTAIGALSGAIIGGAAGLFTSLADAEKDIRQAKIGKALTELGDKLSGFSTGLSTFDNLVGINNNLKDYETQAKARALENSTHTFSGVDSDQYSAEVTASLRRELGPLLPQLNQGITKQAEALGNSKSNVDAKELLEELKGGGGGANKNIIDTLAKVQNQSITQINNQVIKSIVAGQQSRKVEDLNKLTKTNAEQEVNAFGRLLQAVQAATDSLSGLQKQASALTDVLDGNITASHVSSHADHLQGGFGRIDKAALEPLDLIANTFGESGQAIKKSGTALDDVKRILPSVIGSVAGSRGLEDTNISDRVSQGVYSNLGYASAKDAPQEIQNLVTVLQRELSQKNVGDFRHEAQTDTSKYSDKLLSSVEEPFKDAVYKMAKELESNANKFNDELAKLAQRTQAIGQLYDNLYATENVNDRQKLQIESERSGRGNQALDFATVKQLEGATNLKQQRLVGTEGAEAFDPKFLGQQLTKVRADIDSAIAKQQKAFEQGPKGKDSFVSASTEILRLKDRASNLQQALKQLADTTTQQAVLQEKLNRLKQEEEGRQNIGERFLSADPEERLRINQGFILADKAAKAGSLDGFSPEQQKSVIDTLRGAGGVTLTGFDGAPRADDLLKKLVGNTAGGLFGLTGDQKAQRKDLQDEQLRRGAVSEEAIKQLIEHQESGSAKFFQNLTEQQNQFFSRLEQQLVGKNKVEATNRVVSAQSKVSALQDLEGNASLLNSVGVTKQSQVDVLKGRRSQLEELRAAITNEQTDKNKLTAAQGKLGDFGTLSGKKNLNDFLLDNNISGEQANRIRESVDTSITFGKYSRPIQEVSKNNEKGSPEYNSKIDDIYRQAVNDAIAKEKFTDISKPVLEARSKFNGIDGVNPQAIQNVLSGPEAEKFLKSLDAFSNNNKIEDFGNAIKSAKDELEKYNEQLKKINEASGVVAEKHAGGGSIFKKSGTDTVPAMLTPGEFVVNAKSAGANSELLRKINQSHGPVYLADGGYPNAAKKKNAAAAAGNIDLSYLDIFGASPYSRSSQFLAGQKAVNNVKVAAIGQKPGQGNPLPNVVQQGFAESNAVGNLLAEGQARNFNRAAGLYSGVHRPGDDGQRAIAARVAAVENKSFDERFRTDDALQRYVRARVGRQEINVSAPVGFNSGGMVGGAGNKDTVNAMLTPGEFVLNQRSVARLGAQNVQRFNSGGSVGNVNYLAEGGSAQAGSSGGTVSLSSDAVKAMTDLSSTLAQFVQGAGGFGQAAQQLAQTFNIFAGSSQALTQAINNMPKTLSITGSHQVNVVINGAEVLSKLTPEIQNLVTSSVKEQMNKVFKEQLPDAGIQVN